MMEKKLANLSKIVLNGPPAPDSDHWAGSEKEWASHAAWMANNQKAGVAQQMACMVADLSEFSSFRKMLDLGGGPGIFGIAMVKRHPRPMDLDIARKS
jgi:ribosomal protein RSM22 (predicted rRNA methylase)